MKESDWVSDDEDFNQDARQFILIRDIVNFLSFDEDELVSLNVVGRHNQVG